MKIIRLKENITVILNDGTLLSNNNCTDKLYNSILESQEDEESVKCLMIPEFCKKEEEIKVKTAMLEDFNNSKYLTVFGNSVYIKAVSELTIPEDLAVAFYEAEKEGNQELIDTYLNFWTLASLNPDSRARTNLFWFLNRYGMTISKSGLFVAYRNVVLKSEGSKISTKLAEFISNEYTKIKFKWKKSPKKYNVFQKIDEEGYLKNKYEVTLSDESKFDRAEDLGRLDELYIQLSNEEVSPVYTDSYSGSFTIKIGEPVTIDRDLCDPIQENTCSRGLHVAGREWLFSGYFGQISLMVLVNPADVVAVPPDDNYGKMRVCAYYPVQLIERDFEGTIIDKEIEDGFEDDFIDIISYQGEINNEDNSTYTINIPSIPEINRLNIMSRLESIKKSLKNKEYEN